MDGGIDGAQAQGEGRLDGAQAQGDGGSQQQPQGDNQAQVGGGTPGSKATPEPEGAKELRRALAKRDEKVAQMEAQIAGAFKSTEAAEALAKQIEEIKAAADEQCTSFELRLAGARNVAAAKALLGEHDGDVGKLKTAEPWLFADAAGATGLDTAGAAVGGDADMKRWRAIAGLEE